MLFDQFILDKKYITGSAANTIINHKKTFPITAELYLYGAGPPEKRSRLQSERGDSSRLAPLDVL